MKSFLKVINYFVIVILCVQIIYAVTMQQFQASLEMMRNGCAPKFKLSVDLLDKLRDGEFVEGNKELMCYSKCVAQLAGTVTRKGDFSVQKAIAQVPIILPPELQQAARKALNACKDAQENYKESCERVFYFIKCVHDFDPESFVFP